MLPDQDAKATPLPSGWITLDSRLAYSDLIFTQCGLFKGLKIKYEFDEVSQSHSDKGVDRERIELPIRVRFSKRIHERLWVFELGAGLVQVVFFLLN
jgi:hypothetical protein